MSNSSFFDHFCTRACALLLLDYLQKGLRPEPFLRTYRFADRKTLPYCTV